ncbi:hypothetical protein DCCM_3309 [Desulfocucumis palustris]|uniref:Uncharacterized protein n=1 Tax=Desulfocucumis palustris TaxID=1898651 RepID=A0A2L2XCX8_9FIRM|nr:hypothetical protein [Desulfocucumis palustris]GBF34197.1 hypothetical protein DCCM_3309 [Desulfocucumis palustris]
MYISSIIFALVVLAFVVLSLRERIRIKALKERAWDGSETKSSPLSQALSNLIGTAGGIYLSLVMLFSFMEIQTPERIGFLKIQLEPLATLSFVLAIFQPFLLRLWQLKQRF